MGDDKLTPTQQAILYKKDENPEWSDSEIADAVGCSRSHVNETLNRWNPEDLNEDGTVDTPPSGPSLFRLFVTWPAKLTVLLIVAFIIVVVGIIAAPFLLLLSPILILIAILWWYYR